MINWNPDKFIFTIPYLDRPIAYYGLCFFLGFLFSYFLTNHVFYRMAIPLFKFNFNNLKDWPLIIKFFKDHKKDEVVKKVIGRENFSKLKSKIIPDSLKKSIKVHLNKFISDNPERNIPILDQHLKGSPASVYEITKDLVNHVLMLSVVCSLIGSRLFHVFFYDWPYYKNHLLEIPMLHEGGLASHGGIIGIFLAWYLFYRKVKKVIPGFSFWRILDCITITIGLALGMIRIGNFFNQEIIGHATDVPWAVIFGNPAGGLSAVARHPVQLYESLSYFSLCLVMFLIWNKKRDSLKAGSYFAIANILFASARFVMEYFKVKQSQSIANDSFLLMGQYLSIPFIALGVIVLIYLNRKKIH
ncbi:MAG: prolipoprotein diacylglyceryl transferase [Epsilonproteobacteria bacterium]|nr:MAG: prolipoprotein diacylglyceryl transferase [Campylobacterota bacterium]RLA68123.1 MAG: prolipoprotein diacylglyceryl transferase [Campylobacterota bacterium]